MPDSPALTPTIPENSQLTAFRQQIDVIDDRIVELLKERIAIVGEVGEYKRREFPGRCPLRPGREAEQVRRIAEMFKGSAFSPHAASAIWRNIIMASLAVEGDLRISVSVSEGSHDLYWLAREYFGAEVPLGKQASPRRVIGDLLEGKAVIGVLPPLSNDERSRWWPDLIALSAGREERPQIFACLPFIQAPKLGRDAPTALAVGMVAPEETGNDISCIAIAADETTSMHKVQTAFSSAKLEGVWIDVSATSGGKRYHVVEVKGFITPEHEGFRQFERNMGTALMESVFLGAYASPLVLAP